MAAITFSGLSSGIDSASLITQLVTAEKVPATLLQTQQSNLASQKGIVDDLNTQVAALGSLADGMSLESDVQFRTATASDSHVTVAASGDATATSHDVRVLQTAQSQVVSSRTFPTDVAGMLGTGGMTIQNGTGTPTSISWDSTDTLESIASKINDAKTGVGASVLFDGSTYRLMVTASQTGVANAATFTDSGDSLAMSDPTNVKVQAKDASIMLDGVQVTRPTNVFDDALSGVTITAVSAQAASDPDTSVGVQVDGSTIASTLGTLVTAYNAIMTSINNQLNYTGTTAGNDTLFGDSTLRGLKGTLDQIATSKFGSTSMSDLGLTIDKTGILSLDTTQLNTTLAANPNAVSDLFVTGGLSNALTSMTSGYSEPGDGILTMKSQGMTDQTTNLQTQIDQINANATALQTRLQAQFSALEATMSALNSQSTYINKIFAQPTTA
jgi:flagellar hook-associated protein 2